MKSYKHIVNRKSRPGNRRLIKRLQEGRKETKSFGKREKKKEEKRNGKRRNEKGRKRRVVDAFESCARARGRKRKMAR